MDLREKPGKVQTFLELMLRFRLISLVVLVVATVTFVATRLSEIVSLPLGASEAFGMWFAEIENVQGIWSSAQYLTVAGLACVVMLFVFGGIRAGIASIVSIVLSMGTLYVLGGAESMPLPMFGILALVALVLFLFVKWSVACVLFPFVLTWAFLSGLLGVAPSSPDGKEYLVWAVFSTFAFAISMALAAVAGKHLGAGVPQAGALVKAAKQLLAPVLIGTLLLGAAISVDISGNANLPYSALWFAIFIAWFFAFLFPVASFGPWERLRAGNRRVEMKDKKDSKKGTAKKKK